MPVQAIALASILMTAQPPAHDADRIRATASPCHAMVDGRCAVELKPILAGAGKAGDGGNGGNGTVQYNIYFGANPNGGNGGDGGGVKLPPGSPSKAAPSAGPSSGGARQNAAPSVGGLDGGISYFTWEYDFEPEPGTRVWSRKGSSWSERYPSGKVAKVFDTISNGSVKGCAGQLVSRTADPSFEVFLPNKGCPKMVALFRRDMGPWGAMGSMREVR
jgi:hypothetical protein